MKLKIFFSLIAYLAVSSNLCAIDYPQYYNTGEQAVQDLYVDPKSGDDNNNGLSKSTALKTLTAAWNSIPKDRSLAIGARINLLPGTIPESGIPNYMENRYGTATAPIIIQSTEGRASTILAGDLNIFNTKYLYIQNLTIRPSPAGDTLHCEQCDHILLRGNEFDGGNQIAHETIKFNQSSYIFIEGNDIHGAEDNAIDFVAVQYGHVLANKIHNAQDWCQYAKGGSAYLRIEANEYYDCGTGGFTAGQGTGLEFMSAPWIHYEAYDIKFINNIIHNVNGAGFGVNGGYNILLAHNTLYKTGLRSHLIEVVFGLRSCDGDSSACQSYLNQGGWGVSSTGIEQLIPNNNITIVNNLIYNPAGATSAYQHFAVSAPQTSLAGSNLPTNVYSDQNLKIQGNLIWNGPIDWPLGVGQSDQGCQNANPDCNPAQLISSNRINTAEPILIDPARNDLRPRDSGHPSDIPANTIINFNGGDRISTPMAPEGDLINAVIFDRSGNQRSSTNNIVGAYLAGSSLEVPAPPGSTPIDSTPANSTIKIKIGKISKQLTRDKKMKITVNLSVKSKLSYKVSSTLLNQDKLITKKISAKKIGTGTFKSSFIVPAGSYAFTAKATAADASSASSTKKLKIKTR